jgi:hypothetical protein
VLRQKDLLLQEMQITEWTTVSVPEQVFLLRAQTVQSVSDDGIGISSPIAEAPKGSDLERASSRR